MSKSIIWKRVVDTKLFEHAKKTRNEGFFNDITITVGSEKIKANRLVLSCYSSYFKNFFKFSEINATVCDRDIEFENLDGKAVKALIDFCYTGSIEINQENVVDLLAGAHYLKMSEVIQILVEFYHSYVTVDNSVGIFKTATQYKNYGLKEEVQQYISSNLDKVLKTNDFNALSNKELNSLILSLDRNKSEETSVYQTIVTWTRHNEKHRKIYFSEFFKMVNLQKCSIDYFKNVILEEKLVKTIPQCREIAITTFQMLFPQDEIKLLRLGGRNASTEVTVVYAFPTGSSVNYPAIPMPRIYAHCSLLLNDFIYCIGGVTDNNFIRGTNTVWKLNLKLPNLCWKKAASMKRTRRSMGAAVFGDVIVVAGGTDKNDSLLASTEIFESLTNDWNYISSMKHKRSGHALVACGGYLYALGGCGRGTTWPSPERLENLKAKWVNIKPMQTRRKWLAAVNCGEVIYVIGGQSEKNISSTLKTVEKYDVAANEWRYVSNMNIERCGHAAWVLSNKIFVVGGINADGNTVKSIESFNPESNSWCIVGSTSEDLAHHTIIGYSST